MTNRATGRSGRGWLSPQSETPGFSVAAMVGALVLVAGIGMFNVVWWVWLGLTPGEGDDNRFGPPPGEPVLSFRVEL